MPLDHHLKNGEQVEILTAKTCRPGGLFLSRGEHRPPLYRTTPNDPLPVGCAGLGPGVNFTGYPLTGMEGQAKKRSNTLIK